MRRANLDHARHEAERFLNRLIELQLTHDACKTERKKNPDHWYHVNDPLSGSKESGAVRRASLDLTRALAELRKP